MENIFAHKSQVYVLSESSQVGEPCVVRYNCCDFSGTAPKNKYYITEPLGESHAEKVLFTMMQSGENPDCVTLRFAEPRMSMFWTETDDLTLALAISKRISNDGLEGFERPDVWTGNADHAYTIACLATGRLLDPMTFFENYYIGISPFPLYRLDWLDFFTTCFSDWKDFDEKTLSALSPFVDWETYVQKEIFPDLFLYEDPRYNKEVKRYLVCERDLDFCK